jgi:hypothetical protein
MGFWLEDLVARSQLPYPIFFAVLNMALYVGGLLVALVTGNLEPYLIQPRWILMAVFGSLNGTAVFFALRLFRRSCLSIKPLLNIGSDTSDALQQDLQRRATFPIYWMPVIFWLAFSFYHSFILGTGWWTIDTVYAQPRLIAAYGYLYQGVSGCLLGGILMGMLPINLNLAFWKLSSQAYSDNIITWKGKSYFEPLKRLVILNTAMLVISTGIALSLWMEVLPLAPIIGSLAEFIPTAIFPHYLFHILLARAKDKKLSELEEHITSVLTIETNASVGDLIRFEGLLREEEQIRHETTWLIDLHAIVELVAVTFMHIIIVEGLTMILHL